MQLLPLQLRFDSSFGRSSQRIRFRLGENRPDQACNGGTVQNKSARRSSSERLLEIRSERRREEDLYHLFYGLVKKVEMELRSLFKRVSYTENGYLSLEI